MFGLNPLVWWRRRTLARAHARFDAEDWATCYEAAALLEDLSDDESARLDDLALLFLRDKGIETARGLVLDRRQRLMIALQACMPILELGLDWYRGWYSLIVYPDAFVPQHEWEDESGLIWIDDEPKSGEAWEQGPVILSWQDIQAAHERDGFNVVVHEMAHKLDLLDGDANGHPPLHGTMSEAAWSTSLSAAYEDLCARIDRGEETALDPYAGESPGEFFAVASEQFFELPQRLAFEYPAVYEQLRAFYRQDPILRFHRGATASKPVRML